VENGQTQGKKKTGGLGTKRDHGVAPRRKTLREEEERQPEPASWLKDISNHRVELPRMEMNLTERNAVMQGKKAC
jgi:hypothetical protein